MKVSELRDIIIPAIKVFTDALIIQEDQLGDQPEGPHATYKFTTPYMQGVGQAEETAIVEDGVYKLRRVDEHKKVISFTAYSMDEDESLELAQKIHDWFSFFGSDILQSIGVAVAEQTSVTNRDAFVVENYERRNGFDVILRIKRTQDLEIEWIEFAEIIDPQEEENNNE
jgi:hypothetical protein